MSEVRVSLPSISIADTSHATSEAAVVPSFVQRHELSDCVFFLQNRFIGYVAGELRSGKSFIQANESTTCSVEAAEVASRRCALYPLFRCSVVPEEKMPEMLVAPPALERSGAWFHHGYESTHPTAPRKFLLTRRCPPPRLAPRKSRRTCRRSLRRSSPAIPRLGTGRSSSRPSRDRRRW